jgi:hypothetical protein
VIPLEQQSKARPAKAATYWGPAMTESQYAVFHFDVKTMSMRAGEDDPLIFENLADAERYSQEKLAATPGLGFRIHDCDGRIVRTFTDTQVYERFHGQPAAKRNLLVGSACLVAGVGLISLDVWLGLRLILGVFLGVRFLWVAAVKLIDGITGLKRAGAQ